MNNKAIHSPCSVSEELWKILADCEQYYERTYGYFDISLKDYSKIVGAIPVINYVLLGDNNRVETEVNLNGKLEDPEVSTNLTKDTLSVPMNIGKRIINSPSALFDFIKGIGSKEEEKK